MGPIHPFTFTFLLATFIHIYIDDLEDKALLLIKNWLSYLVIQKVILTMIDT